MTHYADKKRILVVGDRAASSIYLRAPSGVRVEVVDTFKQALEKHSRETSDTIVIDPALLFQSGEEVFSALDAAVRAKGQIASLNGATAYIDADYNLIWANPTYKALFGIVIDFNNDSYFDFHSGSNDSAIFECVRNTGAPVRISTVLAQFNTELICTIASLKGSSGQFYGLVISVTEYKCVTQTDERPHTLRVEELQETIDRLNAEIERKRQLEKELIDARANAEQHANEMESLISGMSDGVAFFDSAGNLRLINSAGSHLLGVKSKVSSNEWAKSISRYTLEGQEMPPETIPLTRALNGENIIDERYRIVTVSGCDFIAGVSAAPVKDCNNEVVGATLVFRDIGNLVAFEEQRREVYEREHRIAEILQQALIPPQVSYNIDGCKIVVKYQPALDEAAVGGDFYDIFDVGDGKIGILIGDVAGKGLPAAIRVAAARYSIRSYAFLDPSPSVVMTLANQALCREETCEVGLLTAFFAVMDVPSRTITYANGGHEPPLVIGADGKVMELELQGGGLGFYDGFVYAEANMELMPGDVMVMITDGITEARSASGEQFDKEGVKQYLMKGRHRDLNSLAQGIVESARRHAGGDLQDDAAVVVVQINKRTNNTLPPENINI
ncbi:SpoIIE family protein phosphatase [bacterium]|nr:SpoIIE family protein phosphatase [bacterium]